VAGLLGSWRLDTPAGPSIVVAAVVLLLAANAVGALRQARA
jgi:ABC-type Mn2+/Zn2+ transport system permease subunit